MRPTQKTFSYIHVLSVLSTVLGFSAVVLYFLTPGYGFDVPDISAYLWAAMALSGCVIVLYLVMITLARSLPERTRKTLRSYLWAGILFLAIQVVSYALIIACEADILSLSNSTARTLYGSRIGDLNAAGCVFFFTKKVAPSRFVNLHDPDGHL